MEPIHLAAQSGKVDIINALVNEYGVDPNSKVKLFYLSLCLVIYQIFNYFAHFNLTITYVHNFSYIAIGCICIAQKFDGELVQ